MARNVQQLNLLINIFKLRKFEKWTVITVFECIWISTFCTSKECLLLRKATKIGYVFLCLENVNLCHIPDNL